MEKNKKIIKLCYLQIAFYVVFLTSLLLHFKRGLDHRAFALLIILTLLGCASALTLTDYLKSLIRRSGFDVAGVHDKKSLEEKLLQLQNADDTLDVGVMMFDMNNLKMINDTYGHEEGDVFIQTFASYLTRILTEDSFLARFGGDEFVIYMRNIESKEIASARVKNLIENVLHLRRCQYCLRRGLPGLTGIIGDSLPLNIIQRLLKRGLHALQCRGCLGA